MKTKITLDIHNRIIELTVLEAKLVQEALNEIFPIAPVSNPTYPPVFGTPKSPGIQDKDYYNTLPYLTSSEQKDPTATKPTKDYLKIKS